MKLTISVDGACLGNPGPMGVGIVGDDANGKTVFEEAIPLGKGTNNMAELTAVKLAFEKAIKLKASEVHIRQDSEWTNKILKGEYKIKNAVLIPVYKEIKLLEKKFIKVEYEWVPREENSDADELSKMAAANQ